MVLQLRPIGTEFWGDWEIDMSTGLLRPFRNRYRVMAHLVKTDDRDPLHEFVEEIVKVVDKEYAGEEAPDAVKLR